MKKQASKNQKRKNEKRKQTITIVISTTILVLTILFAIKGVEVLMRPCKNGVSFDDGTYFSCKEIEALGLEEAYTQKRIVKHGDSIYKEGTDEEIIAGKKAGDYCLDPSDTWYYIGQVKCVVMHPQKITSNQWGTFLDEREDYENGFVIYLQVPLGPKDDFYNKLDDQYKMVVCGVITLYDGHPQIKQPVGYLPGTAISSKSGEVTVYEYECSLHQNKHFKGYYSANHIETKNTPKY